MTSKTTPRTPRPRKSNALEGLIHGAAQLLLPFADSAAGKRRTATPTKRHVQLSDGKPVAYTLVRRRRRTIGFTIDDRGLTVTAPQWVSLSAIDDALAEKRDWITRKLSEWGQYANKRNELALAWINGGEIRFLGKPCELRQAELTAFIRDDTGQRLTLPAGADGTLREPAETWLKNESLRVLGERLALYSAASGLVPKKWRLSNARTLWGSCTAQGTIHLNWRLIHLPLELVDYVVVHELAHLREMNHGPAFWLTVETILPNYKQARQRLRDMPEHLSA